ncbi:hypothetical protein GPECTOR_55g301 [Gonium pectorale]|uniref:Sperm-tail PG-rich repeat-containing protein 2 n=1 Tax=Gonium pectorale TaxID=33097 RepID=A0A150G774_GONPE|nr:hypothetical protein GPECTOR_55g301 [Gonium pectorale]|eukprot:KXZ45395.1 hypothetical protein GPECTOR_55g301 [Gonium pectorale]
MQAVGPGAYEVSRSIDTNPAPVPFHTSTERVLLPNNATSSITPGPGAYAATAGAPGSMGGPASPFVSGVPRLPIDATGRARKEVPGPGSYHADQNAWVKGGARYEVQMAPHAAASPAAARVLRLVPRQPTAPSVPGRGESYGYDEGPDGSLMLQSAPEASHSGVGRDTVGPGSYELGGQGPFVRPAGTAWSRSKTDRSPKFGSVAPGVGSYNVAESGPRKPGAGLLVTIGGVEVVFGGTTGTSSFVSKAPRPLQRLPETSPGPGDYNNLARPTAASAAPPGPAASLRNSSAVFGSTAARGAWEVDPTKARFAPTFWRNPGPGEYEDPRVARRGAEGSGAPASAPAGCAPFKSATARFVPVESPVPGPGEYHPDAVTSLEFDTFKRVSGSRPRGAFGRSTGRFPYQRGSSSPPRGGIPGVLAEGGEVASGSPGPAHYEPKLGGGGRAAGRAGMSVFASKSGRFRPVTAPAAVPDLTDYDGSAPLKGDPSRLGPGAYDPDKPTGRTRYKQAPSKVAPFGTESQRAKMELPSRTNPGPGRYRPPEPSAFKPVTMPPPKTGFSSQSDRFGGAGSFTPGPGAYNANAASVVRKSYNVTYSGTVYG